MRKLLMTLILVAGIPAFAQENLALTNSNQVQLSLIDYQGFEALLNEVADYRKARLVSKTKFLKMAEDANTIILDTRSKAAFNQGHIRGSVHLNFSDFTAAKLAQVVPSKGTRILIYCNNNFANDAAPFALKKAELALNVPTFINLYGYGYENIYELGETVDVNDSDMQIIPSSE